MAEIIPALLTATAVRGRVSVYDDETGALLRYVIVQGATAYNAHAYDPSGAPIIIRADPPARNPRTAPQQARRQLHAEAVRAYKDTPALCRALAATEAKTRGITPFQAWCALYHRSHAAPTYARWDGWPAAWNYGLTRWDNGRTLFDRNAQAIWDAGTTRWDAASE